MILDLLRDSDDYSKIMSGLAPGGQAIEAAVRLEQRAVRSGTGPAVQAPARAASLLPHLSTQTGSEPDRYWSPGPLKARGAVAYASRANDTRPNGGPKVTVAGLSLQLARGAGR